MATDGLFGGDSSLWPETSGADDDIVWIPVRRSDLHVGPDPTAGARPGASAPRGHTGAGRPWLRSGARVAVPLVAFLGGLLMTTSAFGDWGSGVGYDDDVQAVRDVQHVGHWILGVAGPAAALLSVAAVVAGRPLLARWCMFPGILGMLCCGMFFVSLAALPTNDVGVGFLAAVVTSVVLVMTGIAACTPRVSGQCPGP